VGVQRQKLTSTPVVFVAASEVVASPSSASAVAAVAPFSEEISNRLFGVISGCLQDASTRPSFADLHGSLRPMLQAELERSRAQRTCAVIPPSFCCPVTDEVMIDPVICSDGHTYERAAIECLESMGFTRVGSAGGECSLVYTNLVCTGCTFIGFCLTDAAS
jgi:hypothetical protein